VALAISSQIAQGYLRLTGEEFAENFSSQIDRNGKEDESQIYAKFFKFHKCYDLIPTSAKLVVFDTHLLVKKAFFALVFKVEAAPLWDSSKQQFIGMLTITDFIKILQMYYTSPEVTMEELEEHELDTWRRVLQNDIQPLVSIAPDSSLILRFLFLYIQGLPRPSFVNKTLAELRIGTYENIETATEDTISALPIIDADGKLVDIYSKFDVINLAANKTYNNLNVTLRTANHHRNEWFEGVQNCKLDQPLFTVMEKLVRAEVHRLVIVDDDEKVIGIISLSDLLFYLVLRPCGENSADAKGSSISLRDQDSMNTMQEPVAAQSETSAADNEPEIEQETAGTAEVENTNATPSPPLSPAA
ncbi:hypothetical protein PV328_012142, partial [Microctonus aethiopoides]